MEHQTKERIVIQLNDEGYLFPGFAFVREQDGLVSLGNGGSSCVFMMHRRDDPSQTYALKVIGFEDRTVSSKDFKDTNMFQNIISDSTEHVVRICRTCELSIITDEAANLIEVNDEIEEDSEDGTNRRLLHFVLMEQLVPIVKRGPLDRKPQLTVPIGTEEEVLCFAKQIGIALKALHDHGILHRDVKLANIFLDETKGIYKLGDFGYAKKALVAETVIFTSGYCAPEVAKTTYSVTADIYSLGITLYLLMNDLCFPGSDGYYPVQQVQYNPRMALVAPAHASEELSAVIRKMCSYHPKDRYQNMTEVLMALEECSTQKGLPGSEEWYDFVTETYHATQMDSLTGEMESSQKPFQRDRKSNELGNNLCYGGVLTVLFFLALLGIQKQMPDNANLLYSLLPIVTLCEAFLLKSKGFNWMGAIAASALVIVSICQMGIGMAHILLLLSLLTFIRTTTIAGALATGLWMLTRTIGWPPLSELNPPMAVGFVLLAIALVLAVVYVVYFFKKRIEERNHENNG